MLPIYHGYVTHVNLCTGTTVVAAVRLGRRDGARVLAETYAGEF
jgi:hypothetical protein